MGTKISLDLNALERLIGGDTDVEIELRETVANEFAKRRLKTFINDHTMARLHMQWQETWKNEIETQIRAFLANPPPLDVYGTDLRKRLTEMVTKLVGTKVEEAIAAKIETHAYRVEGRLTLRLENTVDAAVKNAIQPLIDATFRDRMDARLGALVDLEVDRRLAAAKAMSSCAATVDPPPGGTNGPR